MTAVQTNGSWRHDADETELPVGLLVGLLCCHRQTLELICYEACGVVLIAMAGLERSLRNLARDA